MSVINESSPVVALSEYDIFGLPSVQTTVEETILTEHRPISSLNSGGHIEFVVPTSVNEYILPNELILGVKLRIILNKKDKTAIKKDDWTKVSVVNNFLNSLWSQIDVFIGDTQISTSLQTHSFKSYIENFIGFSDNSKKSFLSTSGWFNDELFTTPHDPNTLRQSLITTTSTSPTDLHIGKIYDLYGKLNLDICFQNRSLLGGTKLRIKLIPNLPEFYLLCSDNNIIPRIEYNEIILNVFRTRVCNDVVLAHNKALSITPARYPITRCDVRTTTINSGIINTSLENVVNGQLPRRCFIAFISNESFNGSFKKNPFYFEHYNIDYIACFQNSIQYPRIAYKPDFTNSMTSREYYEFFKTANQINTDPYMTFSHSEYGKGRTIFGFNFSPDLSDGFSLDGHISQIKYGSMRIDIHFKSALTETINVLIYCEFDNIILIPEDRNAITDYH